MSSNSLVSIIMPAYNSEKYIGDAIESVLNQNHPHWELLIVSDGSTDRTEAIIREYNDPRILLMVSSHKGTSHARNMALENVKGEFICFLDADDRLPSKSIERRLCYMQEHPEIAFCDGRVISYDDDFRIQKKTWLPHIRGTIYKEMMKFNSACFTGITWLIRKETIGNIRFDASWAYFEDRLFFLAIADDHAYDFIDETTYEIRKHKNSVTAHHDKLEESYLKFARYVQELGVLSSEEIKSQLRTFHLIFFKTYLKEYNIIKALKHFTSYARLHL